MKRGLCVTEASSRVGYGHLKECVAVAGECAAFSRVSFAFLGSDPEAVRLAEAEGHRLVPDLEALGASARFDWILLNTRNNDFEVQRALKKHTDNFVVWDELGNKKIAAHGLINFSINDLWHHYEWDSEPPALFLGPAYYPLREEIREARATVSAKKGSVLVSLGGADRSQTTLRLAELLGACPDLTCTYVLGPVCTLSRESVQAFLGAAGAQRVVNAPADFPAYLAGHEFIISSGGDTLYEALYLRKKILIVWEDEHERIQGECFHGRGLARIVGDPARIDHELLLSLIYDRGSFPVPDQTVVDGGGLRRIAAVLKG